MILLIVIAVVALIKRRETAAEGGPPARVETNVAEHRTNPLAVTSCCQQLVVILYILHYFSKHFCGVDK